jgi:ADP-ribose pyrophosphatase YjhB (NUDIX family)
VAAAIVRDGRVLLVRHRKGERTYHLLPGGGVEAGESLAEALEREVAEETGLRCRTGPLLFVSDTIAPDGSRHVVNVTFAAGVSGEASAPMKEARVEGVEWVEPRELPALDLRPPIAGPLAGALGGGKCGVYLGRLWRDDAPAPDVT